MQHKLKVCLQAWNSQKAFATFDSHATPSWLGSYRVQPAKAVLHREVLWDQTDSSVLHRPVELARLSGVNGEKGT